MRIEDEKHAFDMAFEILLAIFVFAVLAVGGILVGIIALLARLAKPW